MRWLMICLLVSLGALLVAAAGVALHIGRQHAKRRRKPPAGAEPAIYPTLDPAEESDPEIET
jgi:flagellar basal body-associated protein FliL